MSGHSKWSTIKHRKGAQDAKRGKIFTKIVKEVTIAARMGGGDPDANPRLRRVLDKAKAANVPSDNISRAIKKGTGELEGVNYEELVYEGVGPGGVLFLISALTDNRNRTAPEIRKLFDKQGGQLGAAGAAAWAFEEKGVIQVRGNEKSEEQLFEIAVGAGAEDLTFEEGVWTISTSRDEVDVVVKALEKEEIVVIEAELAFIPKTPKEVSGEEAEQLLALYEALDEHDDVQKVATEFTLDEEALFALSKE